MTYYQNVRYIQTYFRIGSFRFAIRHPDDLSFPVNFLLFRADVPDAEYTYNMAVTDELPLPCGKLSARRDDMLVFQENGLETRYIGYHYNEAAGEEPDQTTAPVKPAFEPYACIHEENDVSTSIFIKPWVLPDLRIDPVFSSLLCLEKKLIRENGIILHCAYMILKGEAVCFTAPSGTGKSTQAGLWEKYRGTRQVNGDRALLQKVDGRWIARGWPVCGSSGICHNEDAPLRCLVLLSQGRENIIEEMSAARRFASIYPQITVNRWNRAIQLETMSQVDDLLLSVPVYHLTCTISEDAVRCLERQIEGAISN